MAGPHQHAAVTRDQWEDMARGDDVLRAARRVDRNRNGARAVRRADPGGDALARFDADGKGGLVAAAVAAAHQFEAERLDALALKREADEAATVGRHEVDRIGRCHLCGDDEVALVLAVLIVDQHEHAPVAGFLDDFLDPDQHGRVFLRIEEGVELAESFGGRVPVRLGAVAQRVGMKPRRTGKRGARHGAG